MSEWRIEHADVVTWLRERQWLAQHGYWEKYHAVIADPPYFLGSISKRFGKDRAKPPKYQRDGVYQRSASGFMNQKWDGFDDVWDYQAWVTEWASMLLDFVYPGAVLMMFGGTRTYHRLAAGLEDAGWVIADSAWAWCYSTGFPKSLAIDKAIDAQAGATRELVYAGASGQGAQTVSESGNGLNVNFQPRPVTAPATADAKRWHGYGSAIKPSFEPIVIARAPRADYTYADLALQFGTGALNIDAGRIKTKDVLTSGGKLRPSPADLRKGASLGMFQEGTQNTFVQSELGRYPANSILVCACERDDGEHDADCAVRVLDEQSGVLKSGTGAVKKSSAKGYQASAYGKESRPAGTPNIEYGDAGGASRFFYVAKASSKERNLGLDAFGLQTVDDGRETPIDNPFQRGETERRNIHPTLKPIKLVEYLMRLALPPKLDTPRRILIPFSGSGSEMCAAHLSGWDDITGVEMTDEYIPIAEARLRYWTQYNTYDDAMRGKQVTRKPKPVRVSADSQPREPKTDTAVQLALFVDDEKKVA